MEEDLSNTKPILEVDSLEWALGVALVHYSMKARIKKFQDRGEAGMSKELTQMHSMEVLHLVTRYSLTKEERTKAIVLPVAANKAVVSDGNALCSPTFGWVRQCGGLPVVSKS